jgi:hypothetical protein
MEVLMTPAERKAATKIIKTFPRALTETVAGLTDHQLDTPYGEGKWTVRQVVHHLADAHLNAFARLKMILTEDGPTIKPYDQDKWAELPDTTHLAIEPSLKILTGVHRRWVKLLETMDEDDFQRTAFHPEDGDINVDWLLRVYSSHCTKHLGHIKGLLEKKGW